MITAFAFTPLVTCPKKYVYICNYSHDMLEKISSFIYFRIYISMGEGERAEKLGD